MLEESMLEVDCTCVTPFPVLEASGHVAKFQDFMVRDEVTKEFFRADHLLEEHLDKLLENKALQDASLRQEYKDTRASAGNLSQDKLQEALEKYQVKAPKTGNKLTPPFAFNLMFQASIGPGGDIPGFLRPELAQGIFINFPRLLEANAGRVPFAAAQIGQAFRNEIAPRSGLLRVREFTLAEIEHFVKKEDKDHPKFDSVKEIEVTLLPRDNQIGSGGVVKKTLQEAVSTRLVDSQTLGYYIGRTFLFLTSVGIKPTGLRFRQHQSNEMAHYAVDCWDAEILTTYGWIECVGIADRGCYDLTVHSQRARLNVYENFPEPKLMNVLVPKPVKGLIGKKYGSSTQELIKHLENLDEASLEDLECSLKNNKKGNVRIGDKDFEFTPDLLSFERKEKKISGHSFTPNVIEPSFGIGRIIYSIFEHTFTIREGRRILSLPPHIAPVKCSVLPLMFKSELTAFVPQIVSNLNKAAISSKVDTAQSIGRRYARTDEIGIPFGITIDFQTCEDKTVTLRHRDNLSQIRVKIDELAQLVQQLIDHKRTWQELEQSYPKVERNEKDEKDEK